MYPISLLVWGGTRTAQSIRNNDISIAFPEDNSFFSVLRDCFYQVRMFVGGAAVQRELERLGGTGRQECYKIHHR